METFFRVTGLLCGEFTGHRWIPRTRPVTRSFGVFSLVCVRINGWVNNRETGDLERHRAHYVLGNFKNVYIVICQYWHDDADYLAMEDAKSSAVMRLTYSFYIISISAPEATDPPFYTPLILSRCMCFHFKATGARTRLFSDENVNSDCVARLSAVMLLTV